MTRYARGYGSKSCNSKQKNTPSSWDSFKEQVTQKTSSGEQKRLEGPKPRKTSAVLSEGVDNSWFEFGVKRKSSSALGKIKPVNNAISEKKNSGKLSANSRGARDSRVVSKLEIGDRQCKDMATGMKSSSDTKEAIDKRFISKERIMMSPLSTRRHSKGLNFKAKISMEDRRVLRRKEKALKREKKKVCFCCRRFGHQLADCPEFTPIGSSDVSPPAGGLCYHCGSTEHNVNQCSKKGANAHKFARCFVCGEDGHLARQCQENPKGKYPKGGACRFCGETSHLCSECPNSADKAAETEKNNLWCVTEGPLECLPEDVKKSSSQKLSPKKVIQF